MTAAVSPIRQWTVKAPHRADVAVFESEAPAWVYAAISAEAEQPAVVTCTAPKHVFFVFRASADVEVSTRHRFVGTTRKVVEP